MNVKSLKKGTREVHVTNDGQRTLCNIPVGRSWVVTADAATCKSCTGTHAPKGGKR